ncbi:MAG: FMN-binding protein, partial [Planctomycetota bacterium]
GVFLAPNGDIRNLMILKHVETPSYMAMLNPWLPKLKGMSVLEPSKISGVDTVSGATFSSMGVRDNLELCGPVLAAALKANPSLGEPVKTVTPKAKAKAELGRYLPAAFLGLMTLLALLLRRHPGRVQRTLFLLIILVVGGVLLKLQYSPFHLFNLIRGSFPLSGTHPTTLLVVGVPVLVLLLGNLWCGSLCPFGALQELLGDLLPRRWKPEVERTRFRYARDIRYLFLFAGTLIFAWYRPSEGWRGSPLIAAFAGWDLALIAPLLVSLPALLIPRFWCRCLCPAGGALTLLHHTRLLRRFLPRIVPGRCDMGMISAKELGCLQCDRCRQDSRPKPAPKHERSLVLANLALGLAILAALALLALALPNP